MHIRVGYEVAYDLPQPTPMILSLNVHFSRASDIVVPDHMKSEPAVPIGAYRDTFGNWCNRLVAPQGTFRVTASGVVRDSGVREAPWGQGIQHSVESLPDETLQFLLPSRYCESDLFTESAWKLFSQVAPGWERVKAVCDFVHEHIQFGYEFANVQKTASGVFQEKRGVCRDYAHLAISFCRALNIPARYCTGYLGDIGEPPPYPPMDFAAWFEAYLGGAWHVFDPRNNQPRIGRILVARGRDAADVAIATTFGPCTLNSFRVWTDQVE